MNPELVFSAVSAVALVAWLLLVFVPRSRWTDMITTTAVPLLFAVAYVVILAFTLGRGPGDFQSLAGVSALFSNPWTLLAGWIHYLAFDLLIGSWEVRDAQKRDIPHLWVVPCLVLTFMLGPAGWLLYRAVRRFKGTAA